MYPYQADYYDLHRIMRLEDNLLSRLIITAKMKPPGHRWETIFLYGICFLMVFDFLLNGRSVPPQQFLLGARKGTSYNSWAIAKI
jgi:hypothetical protein